MCKTIQRTSPLNSTRKNIVLQFEISKRKTVIFVMYNSPYRLMICRVIYQTIFYDKKNDMKIKATNNRSRKRLHRYLMTEYKGHH
jgi:hypothetical protein